MSGGRPRSVPATAGADPVPVGAADVFGTRLDVAARYVELLATVGVERGLIGPRETGRLWTRHLLNSAAVAELVPSRATVIDLGSGAGLPGIPLALARPDLAICLVEPMQRRVDFLALVVAELGLAAEVIRSRAEDLPPRAADVVVARAVAPLVRLLPLSLPLLTPGGRLLALKGASAAAEIAAAGEELTHWPAVRVGVTTSSAGGETATIIRVDVDQAPVRTRGCRG